MSLISIKLNNKSIEVDTCLMKQFTIILSVCNMHFSKDSIKSSCINVDAIDVRLTGLNRNQSPCVN